MRNQGNADKTVWGHRRPRGAVLAVLCCCGVLLWLGQGTTIGLEPAESPSGDPQRVEGVHTPPPGSAERKAILDALRHLVPEKDGRKALFVVRHMRVSGPWAWVETDPRSADGKDRYEPVECLLQSGQGGSWTVRECRPCCGDCQDDPDCRDKSRFHRSLRTRFPAAPQEIFPEP